MTVDLLGTEVRGYRIVEIIGEGGMATVWRAEHATLGTTVAVKVMDPMLARDSNLVGRFQDEAKTQVKLRHPNIVQLENFSIDPLAMVMEYIEGRTLSEMIGKEVGPIPFVRALPLMRQLLAAISFAHEHKVVHRDIKPSNVVVTPDGEVKIMDFGIAKVLGAQGRTRTGTSMGTPAYMAPEQVKGAKDVDSRADIYALTVTFYEMLASRPPFLAEKETESEYVIMDAHVRKPPPDPREFFPHIPEDMVKVLMKGLAKDPDERFQTVKEMISAIERVAGSVESAGGDETLPGQAVAPDASPGQEAGLGTSTASAVGQPPAAETRIENASGPTEPSAAGAIQVPGGAVPPTVKQESLSGHGGSPSLADASGPPLASTEVGRQASGQGKLFAIIGGVTAVLIGLIIVIVVATGGNKETQDEPPPTPQETPPPKPSLINRAQEAHDRGDYRETLKFARQAHDADRGNLRALRLLGDSACRIQDQSAAVYAHQQSSESAKKQIEATCMRKGLTIVWWCNCIMERSNSGITPVTACRRPDISKGWSAREACLSLEKAARRSRKRGVVQGLHTPCKGPFYGSHPREQLSGNWTPSAKGGNWQVIGQCLLP